MRCFFTVKHKWNIWLRTTTANQLPKPTCCGLFSFWPVDSHVLYWTILIWWKFPIHITVLHLNLILHFMKEYYLELILSTSVVPYYIKILSTTQHSLFQYHIHYSHSKKALKIRLSILCESWLLLSIDLKHFSCTFVHRPGLHYPTRDIKLCI